MRTRRWIPTAPVLWLSFFLNGLLIPGTRNSQGLVEMQKDPGQWVLPGKDYALTRYSELDQVTAENVKDLKVAWTFSTGVLRGHEGAPLVVGDTMCLVTPFPNIVYALDLTKLGAPVKWKYEPQQSPDAIPIACCDMVNRGVAYADGKIFFNQLDTHTVALDAKTGKELWKVKQGDTTRARRSRWSRWWSTIK